MAIPSASLSRLAAFANYQTSPKLWLATSQRPMQPMPQWTAITDVAEVCRKHNIPLIGDGGIRYSGEIAKAIGAGADAVMLGSLFSGTDEAPGEVVLFQGRSYKDYRGMGSMVAMADGSADRYFLLATDANFFIPEGIL